MFQIWNISFDSILWFCASGKSFFPGVVLLLGTVFLTQMLTWKWTRIIIYILQSLALLAIILSTTPLRPAFYFLWLATFITCQIRYFPKKLKTSLLGFFIALCVTALLLELPWHVNKLITVNKENSIIVVGDSISAGMGNKHEKTWPILLEESTGIKTINLARAGATVSSALKKQVPKVPAENGLVIIAIGGNDLLNYNSLDDFENDSNEMLKQLQSNGNQVIWLELPLLPQYYSYGRIQRKLARKNNITLIPKSVLASVFNTPDATSDGMHLTD